MKIEIPANLENITLELGAKALIIWRPISKRLFFVFALLMLAALAGTVSLVSSLFAYEDPDYHDVKQVEVVHLGLNQDKAVVDKVLQLQTANTGPIRPNYVPGRDNPFAE